MAVIALRPWSVADGNLLQVVPAPGVLNSRTAAPPIADESDASYLRRDSIIGSGGGTGGNVTLTQAADVNLDRVAPNVPAGRPVKGVRVKARTSWFWDRALSSSAQIQLYALFDGAVVSQVVAPFDPVDDVVTQREGALAHIGSPSAAQLAGLAAGYIVTGGSSGSSPRVQIHQLLVEMVVPDVPSFAMSGPSGTVATPTVTISSTFTPGNDGDGQAAREFKAWPLAVATAPGFDPNTAPDPAYSSGVIEGAGDTLSVSGLTTGSWRIYGRGAARYGGPSGTLDWSPWVYAGVTVALTTAEASTVTVTTAPSGVGLAGTVNRDTSKDPWVSVEVQRSVGGGPWEQVVDAAATGNTFTFTDAPLPDVATLYRALPMNAGGAVGAWKTSTAASWSVEEGRGWLVLPVDAPELYAWWRLAAPPDTEQDRVRGEFTAAGDIYPVVVSGPLRARRCEFLVQADTADTDALLDVCRLGDVRIFTPADHEFPSGRWRLGKVTPVFMTRPMAFPLRRWRIEAVEVTS